MKLLEDWHHFRLLVLGLALLFVVPVAVIELEVLASRVIAWRQGRKAAAKARASEAVAPGEWR